MVNNVEEIQRQNKSEREKEKESGWVGETPSEK